MRFSTILPFLTTFFPLAIAKDPSCGTGLSDGYEVVGWGDSFKAEGAASDLCGKLFNRVYKHHGDSQQSCPPNGKNSWQFQITYVAKNGVPRQLGSEECYYGLVPIVEQCPHGGSFTGSDGGFHYL